MLPSRVWLGFRLLRRLSKSTKILVGSMKSFKPDLRLDTANKVSSIVWEKISFLDIQSNKTSPLSSPDNLSEMLGAKLLKSAELKAPIWRKEELLKRIRSILSINLNQINRVNLQSKDSRSLRKFTTRTTLLSMKKIRQFSMMSKVILSMNSIKKKTLSKSLKWCLRYQDPQIIPNKPGNFILLFSRSIASRSVRTGGTRQSSKTYVSKLEKDLQAERAAREQLQREIEEIKKVNSEISSKLGLKQKWF